MRHDSDVDILHMDVCMMGTDSNALQTLVDDQPHKVCAHLGGVERFCVFFVLFVLFDVWGLLFVPYTLLVSEGQIVCASKGQGDHCER